MRKIVFLINILIAFSSFSQPNDTILPERKFGSENMAFSVVEKMPEYRGGKEALDNFIEENLKYP